MDIPQDEDTPLILGRPFLLTSRSNINLEKHKLTLKEYDEEITLNMFEIKKQGEEKEKRCQMGMIKIGEESQFPRLPP